MKYPNGLNAPQVKKTTIHVVVKADCFQIEFGMIAGRFRRSCLLIQKMKAGIRTRAMVNRMMFCVSRMEDAEPVTMLLHVLIPQNKRTQGKL